MEFDKTTKTNHDKNIMAIREPVAQSFETTPFIENAAQYKRLPIQIAAELLTKMQILRQNPLGKNQLDYDLHVEVGDSAKHGIMDIYTDTSGKIPQIRYRLVYGSHPNKFHPVWGIFSSHLRSLNEAGTKNPFEMGHTKEHKVTICLPEEAYRKANPGDTVGLAFNRHDTDIIDMGAVEGTIEFIKISPPAKAPPPTQLV